MFDFKIIKRFQGFKVPIEFQGPSSKFTGSKKIGFRVKHCEPVRPRCNEWAPDAMKVT